MEKASFVFHGLFPDVEVPGTPGKRMAKVVFDVEFQGQFHSHLMADIEYFTEGEEQYFEVRGELPFQCADFPDAAVQYYLYTIGPQSEQLTHSGPKGPSILSHNVMRGEWAVDLDAEGFEETLH